jgi:crossover junction endodeoxyribonuclease RuvC
MSTERTYIGIDSGVTGAIACLYPEGVVEVYDLPILVQTTKTRKQTRLDPTGLKSIFDEIKEKSGSRVYATVEEVHPIGGGRYSKNATGKSGDSAVTAFSMGYSYAVLISCLALSEISYSPVSPATWKRKLGLLGSDKEASRTRAIQLFPNTYAMFKRKKDHNRAEAALIGYYGQMSDTAK